MDKICAVEGCKKPVFRRNWCSMHYSRWQRYGDLAVVHKPGSPRQLGKCLIDDCHKDAIARNLCSKHYTRWSKFGDPLIVKLDREQTIEERFWSKVNKNGPIPEYAPHLGPCWIWTAGLADGYGAFSIGNKQHKAHILSYTWAKGEIPEGWERDHLCRVPACVNPDHLEAVAPRINKIRGFGFGGINARKTHCPQDHPYDEENTYINPKGQRICRKCQSRRMHEWASRVAGIVK
jgi:HNH endonuclease